MQIYNSLRSRLKAAVIRRRHRPNIGVNALFVLPVKFSVNGPLQIGRDFFAGSGFYVSTNPSCRLRIGDAVMFGPRVMILGGNHNYTYSDNHLRFHAEHDPDTQDIEIGDGAWVGGNSVILSGAQIGEGAVVGAQSLVNKPLPPYCVAVGQPARVLKSRFAALGQLREVLDNTGSSLCVEDVLERYYVHGVTLPDRA